MKVAEVNDLDIAGGRIRRSSSRFCFGIEHGDYNGTELFGIGTDRFIWLAFKPNDSGKIRIFSDNFPEDGVVEFSVKDPYEPGRFKDSWARFPHGVSYVLKREGYEMNTGFDAVLFGNIPGGGMSRSASLSLNLIETFFEVNDVSGIKGMRIVDLAQMVENDYIGSPCGKLDQIMIYFARAGMGTFFNPKDNSIVHIPLGCDSNSFRIVSMDTGTKRPGLEKSTYKIRKEQCDALAKELSEPLGIQALGDIKTEEMYQKAQALIEARGLEGARVLKYLYEAQKRFIRTLDAWRAGDIKTVGINFRADGFGLRDDYQISGVELEAMCDIARTVDGVYGERMLGGGDKGASGALIAPDAFDVLKEAVTESYPKMCPEYSELWALHACKMVDGITCSDL